MQLRGRKSLSSSIPKPLIEDDSTDTGQYDDSSDDFEKIEIKRKQAKKRSFPSRGNVTRDSGMICADSVLLTDSTGPAKKRKKEVFSSSESENESEEEWDDVDMDEIERDGFVINLSNQKEKTADEKKKRIAQLNRRANFDKKTAIKGQHTRDIVNCLEQLVNGLTNFEDKVSEKNKEIKDILKSLNKGSVDVKVKAFHKSFETIFPKLKEQICPSFKESSPSSKEYVRVWVAYTALSSIGIDCRVCSPCNPQSLLLGGKKETELKKQRFYFLEYLDKKSQNWAAVDFEEEENEDPVESEEEQKPAERKSLRNKNNPIKNETVFEKTLSSNAFNYPHVRYIFSIDKDKVLRDVIWKYTEGFQYRVFRQSRMPKDFLRDMFLLYGNECQDKEMIEREKEMERDYIANLGLPVVASDFKSHPLYVLSRDILQAEMIYPTDVKPIATFGNFLVYDRSDLKQLKSSIGFLMEGLDIKPSEVPAKVVKPKKNSKRDPSKPPAEDKLFWGAWQTERYVPPRVIDGVIPSNKYGNMYVFQEWMVPEGCIHVPKYYDVKRVADSLDIQVVPVVVGFDTKKGHTYPLMNGVLVLEEFADDLIKNLEENKENNEKNKTKRDANKQKKQIERAINHANMLNPKQE
uniref:Rad4 domain-containing protein n=1 Tax=Rhabditophanes sp. KR3021 TaxID=114890 RepID=A0AC35UBA8_9BILA